MFNFLRNLTKSAEEKRYETMTAYLDDTLSTSDRVRFEKELAQNTTLQNDLERERAVKQTLNQLPQRRVPRNFTLDPALYGRPAKQPLIQAYPVLRAATGMAALFFIFAIFAGMYTGGAGGSVDGIASAPNAESAIEMTQAETGVMAEEADIVEVTRIVTETTDGFVEAAEASSAEESLAEEEDAAMEADSAAELMIESTAVSVPESGTMDDGTSAAGEAEAPAPEPTPTAIATNTPSLSPTATVSQSPRSTAVAELNRTVELTPESDTELSDSNDSSPKATAVPSQERNEQEPTAKEPINTLPFIQIGLLLLFIILGVITLYTRRQL